ncbi:VOC family protein [Streptomyces sp. DSM 44917]|uniref:VOC family protein n=1 Tax=Streptomyces boetiae TaxID=3075541 RepID=A0ABU2LEB6_9ACTN|nr:VOC family protein [Streptomyces sp. DSM 44917]MDT0309909.1 VOC family protein [Streptomyces sp. DSM 44917]
MTAPPARFKDLAMDAVDHQALADWWCAVLGYERRAAAGGGEVPAHWPVAIHDPSGQGPLIWFNPVPEPKSAKNRVHFDVWADTGALLARGARLLRRRDGGLDWDVLADPEGNEFCAFTPEPGPVVRPSVR